MQKISNKRDILISIVVINFNNKNGLTLTLQSIKKQNINCYEVIFVDGGSTDGSLEVSNSYSYLFSDILVGQDTGIYNAMNIGIKRACGSYIIFLNSGDYLFDSNIFEVISSKVSLLANDMLIFGYAEITSNVGSWLFPPPKKTKDSVALEQWLSCHEPTHQAMFFPREYCLRNPFDEQLLIISDKKFKRRALDTLDYKFIPLPLVKFSLGGVSNHIKNFSHLNTFFEDYKKYYLSEKITIQNIFFLARADLKILIKYGLQKLLFSNFWTALKLLKR